MDRTYSLVNAGTVLGVVGMIAVQGLGTYEAVDQPHVELDIRSPQYTKTEVVTVSGAPFMTTSGPVIRVGSTGFLLVWSGSRFSVKSV